MTLLPTPPHNYAWNLCLFRIIFRFSVAIILLTGLSSQALLQTFHLPWLCYAMPCHAMLIARPKSNRFAVPYRTTAAHSYHDSACTPWTVLLRRVLHLSSCVCIDFAQGTVRQKSKLTRATPQIFTPSAYDSLRCRIIANTVICVGGNCSLATIILQLIDHGAFIRYIEGNGKCRLGKENGCQSRFRRNER